MEIIIGFFVLLFIFSFAKQTNKTHKKFIYKEKEEIIFPMYEEKTEQQDGSEQNEEIKQNRDVDYDYDFGDHDN